MKKIAFILSVFILFLIPKEVQAWWDSNYSHRFKYVIDNSKVDAQLTDYPILIDLSNAPSEFWDNVNSNGDDIRIIDQDDSSSLTSNSHLEYWDYAGKGGYLWVQKDIATTGNSSFVWIYYGYGSATNPFSDTTKQNTYSSAFATVQHFEESSGNFLDETVNNLDGTPSNISRTTSSLVYGGLSSDGDSDYITIGDIHDETSSPFAYSVWINPNNVTDATQIIYRNNNDNPVLKLEDNDIVFEYDSTANGIVDCRVSNVMSDEVWRHIGIIVDSSNNISIYFDGNLQSATGYCNSIDPVQNTGDGTIGANSTDTFNGYLDEFRILDSLVNSDWMEYTYINDRSLGGTLGEEQPFYIQNLDSGLESYLTSDWSTDIETTVLEGVYNVGIKDATNRIATFAIDFDDSHDWTDLVADSDTATNKAIFHYPGGYSSLPGASGSNFTLYIPRGNTYSLRLCPDATSLAEVTSGCSNEYFLHENDSNVEVAVEDSVEYWKVSGLTGTGGEGLEQSMSFILEGVNNNTITNGITTNLSTSANEIDFGTLMPSSVKYAAQELTVATNAIDGYSVSVKLASFLQGNYPGNQIQEFSYNSASWNNPQSWTSPDGTIPNVNTGWIGANTSDTRVPNWTNQSAKFGPMNASSRLVMKSTESDELGTSVYVTYALEVNSYQPTDKYIGTITYTAVPNY